MAKSKWGHIASHLPEIAQWVQEGAYEYQICQRLGISKPTWEKYKREKPELFSLLMESREERNKKHVPQLINTLLKVAYGYTEEEAIVKEVYKSNDDGGMHMIKEVISKKIEPNVTAIMSLLKNFTKDDKDAWTDNPINDRMKEAKLEMEKKIANAKAKGWLG